MATRLVLVQLLRVRVLPPERCEERETALSKTGSHRLVA